MATSTVEVPLSAATHERLKEVAARNRKSEAEIAATLIESALAADELEAWITRQRLAEADAGRSLCAPRGGAGMAECALRRQEPSRPQGDDHLLPHGRLLA